MAVSSQFTSRYKNMKDFLSYYMGKNTPERQTDIVANLRIEKELERITWAIDRVGSQLERIADADEPSSPPHS